MLRPMYDSRLATRYFALDYVVSTARNGRFQDITPEVADLALDQLAAFAANNAQDISRDLNRSFFRWVPLLRDCALQGAPAPDRRLQALQVLMNASQPVAEAWLAELQRRVAGINPDADLQRELRELGSDSRPSYYSARLMQVSRARAQDLWWKIAWHMAQGYQNVLCDEDFWKGLEWLAGYRFPSGDGYARSAYFAAVTPHTAARFLRFANLSDEERSILQRVANRNPGLEAKYDAVRPQVAWDELCERTGRDHLRGAFLWQLARSTLLYELNSLPPSEEVQALCRAAHLGVDVPPVPGLMFRLGQRRSEPSMLRTSIQEALSPEEAVEIVSELDARAMTCEQALLAEGVVNVDACRGLDEVLRERASQASAPPAPRMDRLESWTYLTNYCGLDRLRDDLSLRARDEVAAALIARHPSGLPSEIHVRAHSALLSSHLGDRNVRVRGYVDHLALRERLGMRDGETDPIRALREVPRTRCVRLLADLYACAQAAGCSADELLAYICKKQHIARGDGLSPDSLFPRLHVQAGFPFLKFGRNPNLPAQIADMNPEHAKQICGMPNTAPGSESDISNRRRLMEHPLVRDVLRRDPELEARYDDFPPLRAWFELCKLTGRLDLFNAFNRSDERGSAASQLDYELRAFRNDPHVAGLRRAACFSDELPEVTGLRYRLGLSANASWPDVIRGARELTRYEAPSFD